MSGQIQKIENETTHHVLAAYTLVFDLFLESY